MPGRVAGGSGDQMRGCTSGIRRWTAVSLALVVAVAAPAATPAASVAAAPGADPGPEHAGAPGPGHASWVGIGTGAAPASLLVRYREAATPSRRDGALERAGAARLRSSRRAGVEVVAPAGGRPLDAVLRALRADPAVASAEVNPVRSLAALPAPEPLAGYQWGLENAGGACIPGYPGVACTADADVDAAGAWQTTSGAGVTVAVLDDGVDFAHVDLAPQAWTNPGESGPDGLGGDRETNAIDDDGNGYVDDVHGVNLCPDAPSTTLHRTGVDAHGTAVASVVAAARNASGMAGVAPGARIMAVRWLVASAGCITDDLAAEAVYYAVDNGADVINASWGGAGMSSVLTDAIAYAGAHGVLFVAAAGNDGVTTRFYPAASDAPNVLAVGAIDPDGRRSSFSNFGTWVDVSAPGSWVLAADAAASGATDGYVWADGTSFAAPHAAGVAALALQAKPSLRNDVASLRGKVITSGWPDAALAAGVTGSNRVVDAALAVDATPPVAPGWVVIRPRSGSTIGTTGASMTIGWGPATDANGISAYRLRYRVTGATTWWTAVASTTARSATVTLRYATGYDVEVAARDGGGNWTVKVTTVRPDKLEEGWSGISWGGSWLTSVATAFSGGSTRLTKSAGRTATFTVMARSIALVMAKGPARGRAEVWLDGTKVTTLNLYSSTSSSYRFVAWSVGWGAAASHTVRLVALGTAGHPRVDLDAVVIGR